MAQMHKALQAEVGSYMRASRGKEARIKDLLGKNEANSKVIENLSTEKADLEDKIKQKKESETNQLKIIIAFEEKFKKNATTIKYFKKRFKQKKMATERLKQELDKSDTEKNELKRLLSEKEDVIYSQNQKLNWKDQNLKILLDEIHKSCPK